MTKHREQLKEYLSQIHLKGKRVVDWGSGAKPVQRYLGSVINCHFITIDKNPDIIPERRGDKHYVKDVCDPIYLDSLADVAFCFEVLEHVAYPDELMENIADNLKQGGIVYISAPFMFEIHAEEDYWRYTKHGLRLLLERYYFDSILITELENQSGYIAKAVKM